MFVKYQSLKQLGKKEVNGINKGTVYIFPKLDGTNSSVWLSNNGNIKAGSRRRELSLGEDNAMFFSYIKQNQNIEKFFKDHPDLRLYGEWLVPHTIKGYEDNAWRRFYIFDVVEVVDASQSKVRYLTYEEYQPILEKHELDYIPLIDKIESPTDNDIADYIKKADFLLKDGVEPEGVVVKNYDYTNYRGDIYWAKYINPSFTNGSTKHKKIVDLGGVEQFILDKYVTEHLIEKEYAKIKNEVGQWHPKYINRLIHTVYYCLITEELNSDVLWYIVETYKNPNIDFGKIRLLTQDKIRNVIGDRLIEKQEDYYE